MRGRISRDKQADGKILYSAKQRPSTKMVQPYYAGTLA
jgi:hypothetical protein